MELFFVNQRGEERSFGIFEDKEACFLFIDKFLEEKKYKSYYKRTWSERGMTMVDVGSWSEFFKIKE